MFYHHIKIAWRNLLSAKGFSFINIAGLSVGMAVAMLIGLWIMDELTYDRFHEKSNQLYQVRVTDYHGDGSEASTFTSVPLPLADLFRSSYPEIVRVAEWDWGWEHGLVVGEKQFYKRGMQVAGDFLQMFSFPMVKGDPATALSDPASIVLTESMSEAIFDNADPIGRTIRVDNQTDVTVTGVVKDPPANSSVQFNFLLPFAHYENAFPWVGQSRTNWNNNAFQIYIETQPGTDPNALIAKIKDVLKENLEGTRMEVTLHSLKDWRLYSEFKAGKVAGGFIRYVRLFGVIGLFVLLIACINFMNLSTARSEKRAREVGIRKTVGSGRGQLILQFLGEAMVVALLAIIVAIVLVEFALPYFNEMTGKELSLPFDQPVFWLAGLGFLVLTGFMAGSYPAFFLSSFKPISVLKGSAAWQGNRANLPRKVLVVAQFTISVALIIGTIVVWQQIQYAKDRPLGYNENRLMMVQATTDLADNYDLLKTDLLGSGMVESVTLASSPITSVYANMKDVTWPGKDPDDQVLFATVATTWDYTKTLGINMKKGRDFSKDMSTDTAAVIFNEAAIKRMGLEEPIGQVIDWSGSKLTIIGVIEDVIMGSPFAPVQPSMIVCVPGWVDQIMFRLDPHVSTADALATLEGIFAVHNPAFPFDYRFADEQYARKFGREELIGQIAGLFGGLAILISCLGLFGLAAFMAERRTKEIGIRKVLGASVLNLWGLLSRDFLGLVLVACVLAGPLAGYFLKDWLEGYEYHVDLHWWVFALAAVAAVVITLMTVSYQSIKAALTNPVKSLRSE